jgi:hypothetical protein
MRSGLIQKLLSSSAHPTSSLCSSSERLTLLHYFSRLQTKSPTPTAPPAQQLPQQNNHNDHNDHNDHNNRNRNDQCNARDPCDLLGSFHIHHRLLAPLRLRFSTRSSACLSAHPSAASNQQAPTTHTDKAAPPSARKKLRSPNSPPSLTPRSILYQRSRSAIVLVIIASQRHQVHESAILQDGNYYHQYGCRTLEAGPSPRCWGDRKLWGRVAEGEGGDECLRGRDVGWAGDAAIDGRGDMEMRAESR